MDSPRRSPRISARTSLEAQQRADTTPPSSSPLATRSPGRQNRQSTQNLTVPGRSSNNPIERDQQLPRKGRASTSNATLNISSFNSKSSNSPTRKPAAKVARRAYSVGGVSGQNNQNRNESLVTSRRNVPGPRKSAIRALPPQVFLSPSELSPKPSIRPLFSRKSLGLEAFGGSDLMNLMESIGIIKSQKQENNEESSRQDKSKHQGRKSEPAIASSDHGGDSNETDSQQQQEDEALLARKKRRVTFNPYQEKTNFEKDEPTMRIRPATELDQVLEKSHSDGSSSDSPSSSASSASSDMSLDSDSESEEDGQGMEADDMEDDDGSESEAEVEGELDYQQNDDSAMDMTAAYGGMQEATISGIASGFAIDDDSMSIQDSSSVGDASSVLDDMTVTMQLTEMQQSSIDPTLQTGRMQKEKELEEEECLEEDIIEAQLSQTDQDTGKHSEKEKVEEEDDDMDMDTDMDLDLTDSVLLKEEESEDEAFSEALKKEMEDDTRNHRESESHTKSVTNSVSPQIQKLPLQARNAPNSRASRSPSPLRNEIKISSADQSMNTRSSIQSQKSPQRRSSVLERRQSDSPRRGHEHCHIPAADSPKPRVSAATLRVQARREASQSPRKSISSTFRASIGKRPSSPEKMPFRSSSSSYSPIKAVKTESDVDISTTANRTGRYSLKQTGKDSSSPQVTRQSAPRFSPPSSPNRTKRPSSPLRSPGSPSKAWQSFRDGQQESSSPKSPARRISMAVTPVTFGTPQRIALPTPVNRESSRPLNVSNTPARAVKSTVAEDSTHRIDQSEDSERWTMKKFFDMLEMGFLDLSVPSKRKIEKSAENERGDTSMSKKVIAACATVPALDGLIGACKELKSSVEDGRSILDEIEKEFYENPPSYVSEVLAMKSSLDRQKAISSFKIQKSAARAIASKAYYGWRTDKQFDDSALTQLEQTKIALERDLSTVREANEALNVIALPKLRSKSQTIENDLKLTLKRQAEIVQWDVEEMRAMHSAMQEQSVILEEQKAMHSETKEQLMRLHAKLDELNQRKEIAQEAIAQANASSDAIHTSTRLEAIRLSRHMEQIETLQSWSVKSATMERIQLAFNNEEILIILHLSSAPKSGKVVSVDVESQLKGIIQRKLIGTIRKHINQRLNSDFNKPSEVIRFISTTWTKVLYLFNTFSRLQSQFSSSIQIEEEAEKENRIVIKSSILLSQLRTKVSVEAKCSIKSLFDDNQKSFFMPEDVETKCIYGRTSASSALNARICDGLLNSSHDLCDALTNAVFAINS